MRFSRAFLLATVLSGVAGCHTRGGAVLSVVTGAAGAGTDAAPPDSGLPDGTAGQSGQDGEIDVGPTETGGTGGTTVATTFYIAPEGSDGNPGTTPGAPWRTFAHALPALQPGSTLVLLDGTYTNGTTGFLQVFCGQNAVNGTTSQPITVRAMNERRAFIAGDGTGPPVELSACANWVLEGVHAEETDVPNETGDEPGSVVVVTRCTNVLLRRMLAAHPNRYLTASAFVIAHGVANVTVEESEALDFHYYGFHAYDTQHAIFRRDYAHSRDTADVAGGQATAFTTRGDGGFLLTKSSNGIVENCIAEDVGDGFTIRASRTVQGGKVQPQRDQLLGDIALGVSHAGFVLDSQCNNTKPCTQGDQIVSDALLSNVVSRGGVLGVSFQGGVNNTVANASVFDATDTGVSFTLDAENVGLQSSAIARDSAVTGPGTTYAFRSLSQFSWSVTACNAFGVSQPFVPKDSHVASPTEVDPKFGACLVVVPDGSPLKTLNPPGSGGLGANVVFRYDDAQLTDEKLWDQATGQFPCGAAIAGINDNTRADVSCLGVSSRLHVGTMGCAIP